MPDRAAGASVTVCVARESLRATALNKICKYHSLFTYDRLPLPNGQLGSNAKSAAGRMPKATRLNQEDRCGVRAESIQDSRLFSSNAFKGGFEHIVDLPVAAALTWQGQLIEGRGVTPSIPVAQPPQQLLAGEDPQMQKALELARQL